MGVHPDMECIAEKLKAASYSTHQIGKWDAGFATFRHIPIARGYDTSFGYLGKSIDYHTKTASGNCAHSYIDLWENDAPAFESNLDADELDIHVYAEELLFTRVLDKLDQMTENSEDEPFFIFYASHLPHHPAELPSDCIEKGYYTEFDDDEDQCGSQDHMIYPDWEDDISGYFCRSLLQAQVSVLDDIMGQITAKLKQNNQWDNTLIVFTTDNGGSLELDETAGNNYPLRGGKASFLEGGIRGTAFVSGGYLPESRRGQVEQGMMHISDWYVTLSRMAGVEAHDYDAVSKGLPDVDGYNMWPLIAGEVSESPRTELVMNKNTLLVDNYKLITSVKKYSIWQGEAFPNSSTTITETELQQTGIDECDAEPQWGCLFDVVNDPTEHNNIADEFAEITQRLISRLKELRVDFYQSDYEGVDSCPDDYEYDTEYISEDEDACGCWMSVNNYNMFNGPYQDLVDTDIHYQETDATQYLFNKVAEVYYYYGIVALSLIVLLSCVCGMKRCQNNKDEALTDELQRQSVYGSTECTISLS